MKFKKDSKKTLATIIDHILPFLDYLTTIRLKYSNKEVKQNVSSKKLDRILDLRNVKIKDENNTIYKILKKHKLLERIIIEFRAINDTHIFQLEGQHIKEINLNGCQKISDRSLIHISKKCPNLEILEIYWIPNITDKGIIPIIENCLKLTYLNLSGCKHVSNKAFMLIPDKLKNLQSINLTRCVGVTDEFLIALVKNINLKYLNLYALPYLECSFLKDLPRLYKNEECNLEFLDICGNQNVNDDFFPEFKSVKILNRLEYLNLSWCVKLTDSFIENVYSQLDNLKLLSLHGLLGITDKTIQLLSQNPNICKNLNTLDVYGCANIINKDIDYLLTLFPNIICFKHHF